MCSIYKYDETRIHGICAACFVQNCTICSRCCYLRLVRQKERSSNLHEMKMTLGIDVCCDEMSCAPFGRTSSGRGSTMSFVSA